MQKFPRGLSLIPALYKRAESNVLLKKYDPALADYESVIQKGRSEFYDKSLFKAATLAYNFQQNFDKALKYYGELANNGGGLDENTLFESQLGAMRAAYRLGRTNDVTFYGDKVYKSPKVNNDQKSTAGFYLGKIAYDQKNYAKANEYLKAVVDLSDNEQTAEARYLLAEILYLQKSTAAAETSTRNAISQNSDYPYWVAKSMILLSDIFVDKNDLFNARAALEAVLENFKEDPALTKVAQTKLDAVKSKQASGSKLKQDSLKINSFFENN
ncbi:MAG: tetratricopeptide repeat protein [Saprospiraceae bacterium]|nr:tetratricopeptide repeat protein [Saprospiraceae bacterium]